jgi:hypothetical protein
VSSERDNFAFDKKHNNNKKKKVEQKVKKQEKKTKEQKQILTSDKVHFTWLHDLFLERQQKVKSYDVRQGQSWTL